MPLKQNNIHSVDELLDQAFGADRQEKTAYRLREGVAAAAELSFIMQNEGILMASLQFWPIVIKDGGKASSALLLGPIAVAENYRGQRIGLDLMAHGLARARELGHERVILVGDEAYYRKAGFSRALADGLDMPGPVDPQRLLAHALVPGAMDDIKGMISKI